MEQERIEFVGVELDLAVEHFDSAMDDIRAQRHRRATSGLYFVLEHLAKALLHVVGVEVQSHGAVARMLALHFVKPKVLSPRVSRHLGNLYERRHTAEYSPRAAWEFTAEEVATYLEWVRSSAREILAELSKSVPEHKEKIAAFETKISKTVSPHSA
jgi:uncharacterized protein (UPF0332 family)